MTPLCPVCERSRFALRRVLPNLLIVRCEECGLRMSEIERTSRTSYAHVDDDAYARSIAAVRREQARRIVEAVRDRGTWLDIGCGYGYVLDEAQRSGFAIRGVEPDAKAASAARARLGEGIVRTDDGRSAEVISTLDVLEHIPLERIDAFAADMHRRANVWVIKVPSVDGLFYRTAHALLPFTRVAVQRLWQSEHEHPHTVYFSEATLARFVRKHGFDVERIDYLEEVPPSTVRARLRVDPTLRAWQVHAAVPAAHVLSRVERWRRKSDALLLLARSRRR